MTEQEAFLAAILARPDDDTVRLAYADWLEENGEEDRGTFIRVQVESALFASLRDGDLSKSKAYAAYLRREAALLDAHRRDWLGGPKCGACGGKGERRRGYEGCMRTPCLTCRLTGYECWPLVETCGRCDGDGKAHGSDRPFEWSPDPDYSKCVVCKGSKLAITAHFTRGFVSRVELRAEQYTAEVAKVIFRHHPTITEVVVSDAHIEEATWTEGHGFRRGQIVYGASVLAQPRQVWGYITGFVPTYPDDDSLLKWFATREEVLAASCAACVAWGRELAGLPPLTPR